MEAAPAASLILMRPGADAPEVLIVQRGQALTFAGGAYVFPGGRVDPADRTLAEAFAGDPDDLAARVAALRELKEETGLDLGDTGLTSEDLARLVPFARWCPPEHGGQTRRFDTRFYLAEAPADTAAEADGGEIVRVFWSTARAVIDAHEAGDGRLLFPTRCLLERLATFADFADARAQAEAFPPRLIEPRIARDGDNHWLTIPEDAGYPYTRQLLMSADRG
jgi:8-oxo-dGTP pyrophosphatase MutT (NUDIX family)